MLHTWSVDVGGREPAVYTAAVRKTLLLAIACLALAACRSDTIDLTYRYPDDSEITYRLVARASAEWDIGGAGEGSYRVVFEVTERVQGDGGEGSLVAVTMTPISVRENRLPSPGANERSFRLRAGPNGEVLEVLELDGVEAAVLDPDELAFIGTYRPPLPLEPVTLGDTWTSEQEVDLEAVFQQVVTEGTLDALDRDRRQAQGALQEHLRAVVEGQERLRAETGSLVSALRKPDVRGRWGEMQLRRVVELAGMTAYCDFVRQPSIDGDDGRLRPDLIVRMPGGKKVVVDAKVPLESYLDAYAADDPDVRATHLRSHARQVREHIKKLSARSYWTQFDDAPDFVVLFLPGEHFLNGAMEAEPALIDEGVNRCVMLATPTTLITLLRAVAYGWQQDKVAEGARAVSEIGRDVHTRLVTLADHLQKVSKRLRGTVDAFNDAVGSLDGRVLPAARRFADHGAVSAAKELHDVDPVDLAPRVVQAPELDERDQPLRALLPAGADNESSL